MFLQSWVKRIPLRISMPVLLAAPVLVAVGVMATLSYSQGRTAVDQLASQNLGQIHGRIARRLEALVAVPARLNQINQALIDEGHLDLDDLRKWRAFLYQEACAFDMISCVEFGDEQGRVVWFARYPGSPDYEFAIKDDRTGGQVREFVYLEDGTISGEPVGSYDYDPRVRPWYQAAIEADGPTWTEPYGWVQRDGSMVNLGIGYVQPYRDADGKILGVLDAELTLYDISRFLESIPIGQTGSAFVVDCDGGLLATSAGIPVADDKFRPLPVEQAVDPRIAAAGRRLRDVFDGFDAITLDYETDFEVDDEPIRLKVSPFRHPTGLEWRVVTLVPRADFLGEIDAARRRNTWYVAAAVVATLGFGIVIGILAIRPALELMDHVRRVGGGDLDCKVELPYSPELERLADEINEMTAGLRDRMHLRQSLALAMEVQQNLLPSTTPQIEGLEISGHSVYCDETGGDYYDFLDVSGLSDTTAAIAVGDVVGHGVAAAMLMATARGILRSHCSDTGSLAALLTHLNEHLVEDVGVGSGRFMTMLLLTIDAMVGEMRWGSAGHDPPFVYDPAADAFEPFGLGGVALGIMGGLEYEEHVTAGLRPGHVILAGTDGVWETAGVDGEFYGKDRVRELIRAHAGESADRIGTILREELAEFQGDAEQLDDVTFVVVKVL